MKKLKNFKKKKIINVFKLKKKTIVLFLNKRNFKILNQIIKKIFKNLKKKN
jgi:hypothetical protein